jgi:hypothetical protein
MQTTSSEQNRQVKDSAAKVVKASDVNRPQTKYSFSDLRTGNNADSVAINSQRSAASRSQGLILPRYRGYMHASRM